VRYKEQQADGPWTMLLLSNAFAAVSLVLFFYSVLFAADASSVDIKQLNRAKLARSTVLLVVVDFVAVYQIVTGQTTSGGVVADPLVTMVAAGMANGIYALSATSVI
jgi:hypothetical protein